MNDELRVIRERERLPGWMKAELPHGENYSKVKNTIAKNGLNTICTSGNCPNKGECWSAGTATFMILGEKCTRDCRFCYVKTVKPDPVDWNEPLRVADAVKKLRLKHCVLTSVARDDLHDGGASFWAFTIKTVKEVNPGVTMEVLIPEFNRGYEILNQIIHESPEVISHNIETVKRLSPRIRSMVTYRKSLDMLKYISSRGVITKSGLMLGLGEREDEVMKAMDDLRESGVTVLTIGQYLQPSGRHIDVVEYVKPEVFRNFREVALAKGFRHVESGPLVRSSYHAERHVK